MNESTVRPSEAVASPPRHERRELLTIVIPARNEEGNIPRLEAELAAATAALPFEFEFIVVDNASEDRTRSLVRGLCDRDPRWTYIRLSRNFTVEMSLTAGYHVARGDAIIVLYSDLQDPPQVIAHFIEKWKEGYDVVYGVRTVRPGDPRWRNLLIRLAYRVIGWFSDTPLPNDAGDFRLITRQVRDALEQCGEYNRYMRGLIAWLGFHQTGVEYERRPRASGRSNVSLWDTFLFTVRAITSFSIKPLRMFACLGFVVLSVSVLAIAVYSVLWLLGSPPPGVTTLIVLGFLAIGLNSLGIGVLGEYIGLIYDEAKARPKYIIQETYSAGRPPHR